jgi:Flp pilus assembly protein TadD
MADEAIKEFREAIALDPDLADAHNNLGIALIAKDRVDEAIEAYREAIELDPENEDFTQNLEIALEAQAGLQETGE